MKTGSNHMDRARLALMIVFLFATATTLQAAGKQGETGGVPMPDIPKAQGEQCVADTGFMRRNHMDLLEHQRDETVIEGLRGEPFSLKDCISCHAVIGPDGQAVTVDNPNHFCRACHDYAAVSIDCFQCHASRPELDGYPKERQFSGTSTDLEGGQ